MGLTLPLVDDGICIDSSIVIYLVESHSRYRSVLEPWWMDLTARGVRVFASELAELEATVIPLRLADQFTLDRFRQFFDGSVLRMHGVTRDVLRRAAELRAAHPSLRTPDSIHLATAQLHGARHFVTNDRRLTMELGLTIHCVDDVLGS